MSSPAPMRMMKPLGTMVEVPSSTITAGPARCAPVRNAARTKTVASTASPLAVSTMRQRPDGMAAPASAGMSCRAGNS
jgi:hypothetical protein